jgi:hypothetical protein
MITDIAELVRIYTDEQILTDGEYIAHAVLGCIPVAGVAGVIEASPGALGTRIKELITLPAFGPGFKFFSSGGAYPVSREVIKAVDAWKEAQSG